jgi:hypothetical protein
MTHTIEEDLTCAFAWPRASRKSSVKRPAWTTTERAAEVRLHACFPVRARALAVGGVRSSVRRLTAAGIALWRRADAPLAVPVSSRWRRSRSRGTSLRSGRSAWRCSSLPCSWSCERARSDAWPPPPPCGPQPRDRWCLPGASGCLSAGGWRCRARCGSRTAVRAARRSARRWRARAFRPSARRPGAPARRCRWRASRP